MLRKTNTGNLLVRYENSVIANEDWFILFHKPDDLTEDVVLIGKYRNMEEIKEAGNKYIEEDLPF